MPLIQWCLGVAAVTLTTFTMIHNSIGRGGETHALTHGVFAVFVLYFACLHENDCSAVCRLSSALSWEPEKYTWRVEKK